MFDAVFPQVCERDPVDGELWRDTILSAVDTISEDAVSIPLVTAPGEIPRRSRVSEEIRNRFRKGDFASVNIAGLYSICEYSNPRELSVEAYDVDPRVQIVQSGGSALLDCPDYRHGIKPDEAVG